MEEKNTILAQNAELRCPCYFLDRTDSAWDRIALDGYHSLSLPLYLKSERTRVRRRLRAREERMRRRKTPSSGTEASVQCRDLSPCLAGERILSLGRGGHSMQRPPQDFPPKQPGRARRFIRKNQEGL